MEARGEAAKRRLLRILVADERREALDSLRRLLEELGHEVLAQAVSVAEVGEVIASEGPDVSLVRLHEDDAHALALIAEIAGWAGGPVLALLDAEDPDFVSGAAGEGAFAVVHPVTSSSVQSAIECALLRYAEVERLGEKVDQLETALERRTVIERAKGILMERHGIGAEDAFERLRSHARSHNRRVVDVARTVNEGLALLPKR
jgi:response regulator NasT